MILRLSRRGMVVIGFLGIGGVAIYALSHVLFIGSEVIWTYRPGDPLSAVTVWEKLVIVVLCVVSIVVARSRLNGRGGRLLVVGIILMAVVALLADDVARSSLSNSPIYLIIVMLCGVGTMPYKPRHMMLLSLGVILIYALVALIYSDALGISDATTVVRRVTNLVIAGIICTGISALLYRTRYDQYRALQEAESLRDQVVEQKERLIEAERAKSRFFANVSHEFRTPLTLILGPLEDSLREVDSVDRETLKLRFGIMRRSAVRLKHLIDELLDLTRLEAGGMKLHVREHDLMAFLRSMVGMFESMADARKISLWLEDSPRELRMETDADKLGKIVTNLLSNALKFTEPHGKVNVFVRESSSSGQGRVSISVQDTGRGIPPEKVPHVFERFYRVEESTDSPFEGTGIGLSLVKALAELLGGSVEVQSKVGFGSTFTVHLPRRHRTDEPTAEERHELEPVPPPVPAEEEMIFEEEEPEESRAPMPTDAPVVLVIDDNADMRAHLREILSRRYHVAEAEDGQRGLERVRKLLPALVICDVMMPGLDGYTLCQTVRQDSDLRHIPIIMLTARADEESRLEGLSSGANDYLAKPFGAAELLMRAENLIEIRRSIQTKFSGEVFIHATEISVPSADATLIERVKGIIEANIGNTNFGVDWLADEVGYHPRQLQRKLRSILGMSVAGYVRMLRLERAASLLAQRAGTVAEIAYMVGYNDPNHFSKLFKQVYGVPPSEYAPGPSETEGRASDHPPIQPAV